jgi:hypothetical protein
MPWQDLVVAEAVIKQLATDRDHPFGIAAPQ